VLPAAVFVLPVVFAGATLLSGTVAGLYWLPVAVIASVVGGLRQAWVLLIEILR
jgi:energy-converting hydrogenase Eha subunit A